MMAVTLSRRIGRSGSLVTIITKSVSTPKSCSPGSTDTLAVKELPAPAGEIFALNAAARDFYVLGYEAAEERTGGSDWRASPVTI